MQLALTSRTIINNNGDTKHPILVTDFNGTVCSVSILTKILLLFIRLRDYPTLPKILKVEKEHNRNDCGILANAFQSLDVSDLFSLLMNCII